MWLWPDERGHSDEKTRRLRGWVRRSWRSTSLARSAASVDSIIIDIPGVYVAYSRITFGCSGERFFDDNGDSITHSYQHEIFVTDGKGGRSVLLIAY